MARNRLSAEQVRELERRIGHTFSNHERLHRALTHSSASRSSKVTAHYERLEFLGDRVLGLCIAEMLYTAFPDAHEGELSVRLNTLVSGKMCAMVADEIDLHKFIRAGADVKQLAGKRMRSVRADVVESLIATIYLDAGLAAAQDFVRRFWADRLHEKDAGNRDSKTALQEWAHADGHQTPTYRVVDQKGPDHEPEFILRVEVDGLEGADGTGRSKRSAEQLAAQNLLLREGAWTMRDDGTIEENRG